MKKNVKIMFLLLIFFVMLIIFMPAKSYAITSSEIASKLSQLRQDNELGDGRYYYGYYYGTTCYGFANKVAKEIFGCSHYDGVQQWENRGADLSDLCIGDVVTYREQYSSSGEHAIIVTNLSGETVYITESNYSGAYKNDWEKRTMTKSQLYAKGVLCVWHYKGNNVKSFDSISPTIEDAYVSIYDIQSSCFRIEAKVSDNIRVSKVSFATWTQNNGQDDLKWYDANYNSSKNLWEFVIETRNHKNETGLYNVHVYAYDEAGNYTIKTLESIVIGKTPANLGNFTGRILANSNSNKVLGINGRTAKSNVVIKNKDLSDTSQLWKFERDSSGNYYRIKNLSTGLWLHLNGALNDNGTEFWIYDYRDNDAQKFYIMNYNGGYRIVPKCSENMKALDINGNANYTVGTKIILWEAQTTNNPWQTLKFEKVAQSISLNKTSASINVGNSVSLTATISPSDVANKNVTWKSSNTSVATVSSSGVVTGKSSGTVTITATTNDGTYLSKTCTVTVIQPVTCLLNYDSFTFTSLNQNLQLNAHLNNGQSTTFTYTSSNPKVLKVNSNGVVTALKPGVAYVTVKDSKYNVGAICDFYVQTLVTLSDGSKAYVGDMNRDGLFNTVDSSKILDAFKNGATRDDILIGDLNNDGILNSTDSAISLDLYKNGLFSPGRYYKITGVKLNINELSLGIGNTQNLKATINPQNTTDNPTLTWTSSNTNVATVNASGKITAKSEGTTNITVKTSNGKTATCKVTVKKSIANQKSSTTSNITTNFPNVSYRTHVQNIGWQNYVKNGATAGTTGKALRLEGINIKLENNSLSGNIEYCTHVQNIGWQNYVKNGAMSGTSGRSLRLEAIKIRLTGELAKQYDIYYRVHCENFGWMGWAKNGASSGSAGYSYRLEAIQIKIVKKNEKAPGSTANSYKQNLLSYQTHVENIGWQGLVNSGEMSGTSGQSLRLEGIKINLNNSEISGNIEYCTHVQNIGWQNYVKNGEMSGTTGRALRLEAIKIRLTGDLAKKYDVYYRVHCQNFGWMGWAKNGAEAGSAGFGYRLEGIEIVLVEKGGSAPGSTANSFRQM